MNKNTINFIKNNANTIEMIIKEEREHLKERITNEPNQDKRNEIWYVLSYLSAKVGILNKLNKPPENKDTGI